MIWGTIAIQYYLSKQEDDDWNLKEKNVDGYSSGVMIAVIYSALLGVLISVSLGLMQFRPKSKFNLLTFVKGLNIKSCFYPAFYFFHFFLTRLAVSFFIAIYQQKNWFGVKTTYFEIIALMQGICWLLHLLKIYASWTHYLLSLIRET